MLFYGCNLAESDIGQSLLEQMGELTGADVAASDDLTGSSGLGGDWIFEYVDGDIESALALSEGTCSVSPDGSSGGPSCTPYLCDGLFTTCPSSCASDADCSIGNYCDSLSQCVGTKANGATCSAGNECASGNCVDGYCCNTVCGASCDACKRSLKGGACGPSFSLDLSRSCQRWWFVSRDSRA